MPTNARKYLDRIQALVETYGRATVADAMEESFAYSERRMRQVIEAIPDGVYHGEDFMDDDGVERRPYRIAVTVHVNGGEIVYDFAGTDTQAAGPINTPYFSTCSAVYCATRKAVDAIAETFESTSGPLAERLERINRTVARWQASARDRPASLSCRLADHRNRTSDCPPPNRRHRCDSRPTCRRRGL